MIITLVIFFVTGTEIFNHVTYICSNDVYISKFFQETVFESKNNDRLFRIFYWQTEVLDIQFYLLSGYKCQVIVNFFYSNHTYNYNTFRHFMMVRLPMCLLSETYWLLHVGFLDLCGTIRLSHGKPRFQN